MVCYFSIYQWKTHFAPLYLRLCCDLLSCVVKSWRACLDMSTGWRMITFLILMEIFSSHPSTRPRAGQQWVAVAVTVGQCGQGTQRANAKPTAVLGVPPHGFLWASLQSTSRVWACCAYIHCRPTMGPTGDST